MYQVPPPVKTNEILGQMRQPWRRIVMVTNLINGLIVLLQILFILETRDLFFSNIEVYRVKMKVLTAFSVISASTIWITMMILFKEENSLFSFIFAVGCVCIGIIFLLNLEGVQPSPPVLPCLCLY